MISIAALAVIGGCSDDATRPNPSEHAGFIRGTVVDADGNAVAGAGIVISLRPTLTQSNKKGSKPVDLRLQNLLDSTIETVWITDFCSNPVIVLCDGDCPQDGAFNWDGRNDAGKHVGDGVYFANVQSSESLRVSDFVLVREYETSAAHATHEFSTLSDAGGRFEIAQDCLPFGHSLELPDGDEEFQTITVSRWVNVVAVSAEDQTARQDAVFVDERKGVELSIRYP